MENLVGLKFGKLTVISYHGKDKNRSIMWDCVCDCGNVKKNPTRTSDLKNGTTRSCGCVMHETNKGKNQTHGMTRTRLYNIYKSMMNRCYCKSNPNRDKYGGRGITVCDEWRGNFVAFYNWSMNNGYSDELSIDRIDVNGNYSPDNCRWATVKQQSNNKRNNRFIEYKGNRHTISEWASITGIPKTTLRYRLNNGWQIENVFVHSHKKGETVESHDRQQGKKV